MSQPKLGKSSKGEPMHYSVGAVIKRGGKFLLLDRKNPPPGFAGPAGHIDEGEDDPVDAVKREVEEETALKVNSVKFLAEGEFSGSACGFGISSHYWYLYECETIGELKLANKSEEHSIGWYSPEEMKKMKLEEIWEYWFRRLKII